MTKEEAINTIHCALDGGCSQTCNAKYRGDCTDNDIFIAMNMAIEALEITSDKDCSKCKDRLRCAIHDNFNIDYCSDWNEV